jgi:hypothetical protein
MARLNRFCQPILVHCCSANIVLDTLRIKPFHDQQANRLAPQSYVNCQLTPNTLCFEKFACQFARYVTKRCPVFFLKTIGED